MRISDWSSDVCSSDLIDPQHGAVAIGEYVDTGDTIMFCRRDHGSAVEDMRRMLADLKRRTGSSPIRGALYFSCCGRGPNQFGQDSRELRIIADELGDFPLVGFFRSEEHTSELQSLMR